MNRYTLLIGLIVFSLPLSISFASENNKRIWIAGDSKIIEKNSKIINVIRAENTTKHQFDLDIYDKRCPASAKLIASSIYELIFFWSTF